MERGGRCCGQRTFCPFSVSREAMEGITEGTTGGVAEEEKKVMRQFDAQGNEKECDDVVKRKQSTFLCGTFLNIDMEIYNF